VSVENLQKKPPKRRKRFVIGLAILVSVVALGLLAISFPQLVRANKVAGILMEIGSPALIGKQRSFSFSTNDMAPTLEAGDYVLADTEIYRGHDPQRGDIAFFTMPEGNEVWGKRIMGLPGERI
jgi:hypothetical protein